MRKEYTKLCEELGRLINLFGGDENYGVIVQYSIICGRPEDYLDSVIFSGPFRNTIRIETRGQYKSDLKNDLISVYYSFSHSTKGYHEAIDLVNLEDLAKSILTKLVTSL